MNCHSCHAQISDDAATCPVCEATVSKRTSASGVVSCVHCGTAMTKGKKVQRNMGLQVLGVFLFVFAVGLLWWVPIGTVLGVVLMFVAMQLGYTKKTGWKCSNCGYFFERA